MASRSMMHLNGNILACVDVETTGLKPRFHDTIQVCVLPLNADIRPLEGVMPFYTEMKPKRPENYDEKTASVHKVDFVRLLTDGLDPDWVSDRFRDWYETLPLPEGKKLVPLAHNWIFDHAFMEDWLGWEGMNYYFHGHHRDLLTAGLYENDKAAFHVTQYPYPKLGLKYFCSQLGVENQNAHDALADCVATAECYRRVVKAGMWTPVNPQPENLP